MRLGILGGTFDPVHVGHLAVARAAMREAGLDSVLFLPDGDPPHKTPGAPGADRLEMVRLAIAGEPGFTASDLELVRPGRTYTVDTLLTLRRLHPDSELHYIIGSDTLPLFPTWRTAGEVARLCRMIVVPRPGNPPEQTRREQARLLQIYGLHSRLLASPGPDVSSSLVRAALQAGEDVSALIPSAVVRYIQERGLYQV